MLSFTLNGGNLDGNAFESTRMVKRLVPNIQDLVGTRLIRNKSRQIVTFKKFIIKRIVNLLLYLTSTHASEYNLVDN